MLSIIFLSCFGITENALDQLTVFYVDRISVPMLAPVQQPSTVKVVWQTLSCEIRGKQTMGYITPVQYMGCTGTMKTN